MVTAYGFHTGAHVIPVPYEEHLKVSKQNRLTFNVGKTISNEPDKRMRLSGKIKMCTFGFKNNGQ